MPLFDSLSAAGSTCHRLAKMKTIPTTDDLRYALDECKAKKKCVELPFEHPSNHETFMIRVSLGLHTAPPTWTLLRGETGRAPIMWTRATAEVMTIQSQVKSDSARAQSQSQPVPAYVEEAPPPAPEPEPVAHAGGNNQPPSNQGVIVTPTAENRMASAAPSAPPATTPTAPPNTGHLDAIDWTSGGIGNVFQDPSTGFMSFNAFTYFLLRSWNQFVKNQTPFSVCIYTVAIRYPDGTVIALPSEALVPLSGRLQSACSAVDVMAHSAGGEFVVLLPGSSAEEAADFCQRLYASLTETALIPSGDGQDLAYISIGAASLPEHCGDPEALLAGARAAKQAAREANQPISMVAAG